MARKTWTGGSTPPKGCNDFGYLILRRIYFREYLNECGGLDLWACAGTSPLERARILWNRAKLDAWASVR